MKKFIFISMVTILLFAVASCQKDQDTITPSVPSTHVDMGTPDPGDSGDVQLNTGSPKAAMTGYSVTPRFGKPNSTYYLFKVMDVTGTLALSVKLYDRASGSITYLPMAKVGSYWTLSTKLSSNGWFDYNYVYSANKVAINNSVTYTGLCNSKNMFNSSPFAIVWPFGADGSSWSYRNTWNGGQEGGSGYGWNEGTHTGTSECYSDDWNRTNDLGAIIRSPLDGYIEQIGQYYVSGYGYSKYISIIQQSSNGTLYRFYVGHLQSYPSSLYVGKYVRAGIDQIGNVGSSGASSPHAHTNMRVNGSSVAFYFNAQ